MNYSIDTSTSKNSHGERWGTPVQSRRARVASTASFFFVIAPPLTPRAPLRRRLSRICPKEDGKMEGRGSRERGRAGSSFSQFCSGFHISLQSGMEAGREWRVGSECHPPPHLLLREKCESSNTVTHVSTWRFDTVGIHPSIQTGQFTFEGLVGNLILALVYDSRSPSIRPHA